MYSFVLISCVAMLLVSVATYTYKGHVSAIGLLININFASHIILHNINPSYMIYVFCELFVYSSVSVACYILAFRANSATPYLLYSLVLFGFIFVNGLFILNPAYAPNEIYMALTIMEIMLFIYGSYAALTAKTRNDTILNSTSSRLFDSFRRICGGRSSTI